MASDRSHPVTVIGRRLVFLLLPLLAVPALDSSSALTVALLALTLAVVARSTTHAEVARPARAFALTRADGLASYAVRRATDPRRSPRRPRAPEPA